MTSDQVIADWKQDTEWEGNPSLGLLSFTKKFFNPFNNNRKVPVTVFGKEGSWSFCVNAGANSDFSYTGYCVGCITAKEAMRFVDNKPNLFR